MNKTTLENWEDSFDEKFPVNEWTRTVEKENGKKDTNFVREISGEVDRLNYSPESIKSFIKDLLASSQKDKEKAVEEAVKRYSTYLKARGLYLLEGSDLENKCDDLEKEILESLKSKKE